MGTKHSQRKLITEFRQLCPTISRDKLTDLDSIVNELDKYSNFSPLHQYSIDDRLLTQLCVCNKGELFFLPIFHFGVTNKYHIIFDEQISDIQKLMVTITDKSLSLCKELEKTEILLTPLMGELEKYATKDVEYSLSIVGITIANRKGVTVSYKFKYSEIVDEINRFVNNVESIVNFLNLDVDDKRLQLGIKYAKDE